MRFFLTNGLSLILHVEIRIQQTIYTARTLDISYLGEVYSDLGRRDIAEDVVCTDNCNIRHVHSYESNTTKELILALSLIDIVLTNSPIYTNYHIECLMYATIILSYININTAHRSITILS